MFAFAGVNVDVLAVNGDAYVVADEFPLAVFVGQAGYRHRAVVRYQGVIDRHRVRLQRRIVSVQWGVALVPASVVIPQIPAETRFAPAFAVAQILVEHRPHELRIELLRAEALNIDLGLVFGHIVRFDRREITRYPPAFAAVHRVRRRHIHFGF